MDTVLTSSMMKRCDYNTINHYGIKSAVLMERASLSVANVLTEHISLDDKILVFVGSGNNGGDGICLARILHNMNYEVAFILCADRDKYSDDLKEQLDIATNYNIKTVTEYDIDTYDVYVDAILGIGLSREVISPLSDYIDSYNKAKGLKVAIDIPSGINSDNGNVLGVACKTDITVTFNYLKAGHLLYPGRDYSGKVYVKDIGINDNSFLGDVVPTLFRLNHSDLYHINNRRADTNKGDYGKVLIIAGSEHMSGCAYLSAMASLRMGAGLVKVYTAASNYSVIGTQMPEALISTYDTYDERQLISELNWSTVCVIGPGIGLSDVSKSITKYVLSHYNKPLIIDADALNIISDNLSMLNGQNNRIITPHVGEMSRLIGKDISYIKSNMIEVASSFAREHNVITALKSASSVIATPKGRTYINSSGNNGMATAGSGDVLTGIIAALLANNIDADISASLGVYIHGLCGDYAKDNSCEQYMIASDIILMISKVIKEACNEYK